MRLGTSDRIKEKLDSLPEGPSEGAMSFRMEKRLIPAFGCRPGGGISPGPFTVKADSKRNSAVTVLARWNHFELAGAAPLLRYYR